MLLGLNAEIFGHKYFWWHYTGIFRCAILLHLLQALFRSPRLSLTSHRWPNMFFVSRAKLRQSNLWWFPLDSILSFQPSNLTMTFSHWCLNALALQTHADTCDTYRHPHTRSYKALPYSVSLPSSFVCLSSQKHPSEKAIVCAVVFWKFRAAICSSHSFLVFCGSAILQQAFFYFTP